MRGLCSLRFAKFVSRGISGSRRLEGGEQAGVQSSPWFVVALLNECVNALASH